MDHEQRTAPRTASAAKIFVADLSKRYLMEGGPLAGPQNFVAATRFGVSPAAKTVFQIYATDATGEMDAARKAAPAERRRATSARRWPANRRP